MIRPITIGYTNFRGNNTINRANQNSNENNEDFEKLSNRQKEESLVTGFLFGAAFASAMLTVLPSDPKEETKELLNDMKAELDASHDKSLLIEDITGDGVPEIIFEDMNGSTICYDFMKSNINVKNNDENSKK